MRSGVRLTGAIVAVMAAILVAAPVAAAGPWTVSRETGTRASAHSSDECADNPDGSVTCDSESVHAFKGRIKPPGEAKRKSEHVCYHRSSYTFDPNTGNSIAHHERFGCTDDAGTLTVNGLRSIRLAPTVIALMAIECDESGECTESEAGSTTLRGTWTGAGPISRHTTRSRFDDGTCVLVHVEKGRSRGASFEGSFDATDSQIGEGNFTFRTNCTI